MSRRLSWKPKRLRLIGRRKARTFSRKIDIGERRVEAIATDTRLFVWQRDGGKCRNCGCRRELHFDHIIPRSRGGSNLAENIELLCKQCNLKKGTKLFASRPVEN